MKTITMTVAIDLPDGIELFEREIVDAMTRGLKTKVKQVIETGLPADHPQRMKQNYFNYREDAEAQQKIVELQTIRQQALRETCVTKAET